ncbi:MAG: SPFH domain-containing protein [Polaribacter sp.]|jgi:membrane protease subunit (stomatin/prohibitin family)|nr:SPFH domain-containing protein [Polaribacter sp.]
MAKLMEVIQYSDETGTVMCQRVPDVGPAEIKWGAQLTVRESQEAVFMRDGRSQGLFLSGRHVLKTQNIPVIGKWVTSFGYGESSPFIAEVYFLGKQLFANLKWGTPEQILFKDTELKMIRLRAFGTFSIQISDSNIFLNKVVGTRTTFFVDDIEEYLRSIIISKFTTVISENLKTVFDMPSNFDILNISVQTTLKQDFEGLGLLLHDFYINSISLPQEVQQMIDQRTSIAALGNLDDFLKFKLATSLEDAAKNEGGAAGSLVGAGAGLGMGLMMPNMINQSVGAAGQKTESPLEKIKQLKELLDIEAITEEEFNKMKNELLNKM